MKSIHTMLLGTASLIAAMNPAEAATNVLTEPTEFSSSYFDFDPFFSGNFTSLNTLEPTDFGSFIADYSELGADVLTFTWQAPRDQRFVIDVPANATSALLDVRTDTFIGGLVGGRFLDSSPIVTVNLLSGPSPTPDRAEVELFDASDDATGEASFFLTPGETYQIESVSVESTVPASFNNSFNQPFTINYFRTVANFTGDPGDPGQWLSLELAPVPEPSAALLVVLGAIAGMGRRRSRSGLRFVLW